MAYSTNPNLPKARATALRLLLLEAVPLQVVARKCGVHRSTIYRWKLKWLALNANRQLENYNRPSRKPGRRFRLEYCRWVIPTSSSRPHGSPRAIVDTVVARVLELRRTLKRCAEVIWYYLTHDDGIYISLSSVRRILKRTGYANGRKKRVRPDNPRRPHVTRPGELVETDTIHHVGPDSGRRLYYYTVIDLFTRMTHVTLAPKLNPGLAAQAVLEAQDSWGIPISIVQTDNGPEYGRYFEQSLRARGITTRHTRLHRPNDNAHIERFNRTIQTECIGYYWDWSGTLLFQRDTLTAYLDYYNTERVHLGLQLRASPNVAKVLSFIRSYYPQSMEKAGKICDNDAMQPYSEAKDIAALLQDAKRLVIIQADNPDGDSLGSALALEQILGDMGKEPFLYCGVDIPTYLTHLSGWDRVSRELPQQFDMSIIVDTSADSLLEQLAKSGQRQWVASKPCIVIDHHDVEMTISYAKVVCNHPAVATGEVIYELARQLDWPLSVETKNMLAVSILADSLGLTTDATTARSIHIIAELVDGGVRIPELEEKRREMMRKAPELVHYKGELLQRVEYYADNRIATVTIPWEEIEQYSHAYNPSMLVIDDMRLTENTDVAIAFKLYNDGHMTAKIRCNYGKGIANDLAQAFSGGGHPYASGFKITNGRPFNEVKSECIAKAIELLENLDKEASDETIQHANT